MEGSADNHNETSNNNNGTTAEETAVKAETPVISIKVVNADGAEMFFRIKAATQLKKLIDAYCKKQGISRSSVRFLFDGSPIDESKTPKDLGMEDDDVIDAMVEQTGGQIFY
ncbi:Rad60/SUMO-like domain [Trypanosoma melophagium]|uniref:Rad60/SUMO-like domain n=1 Tax=Trypanosoma melophagium TaxID=715481 RepID=UPI00351AAB6F|nr:Rad60/SUMO-like domain [Trypanosoma melophagium]KAH9584281.1 Rad60/SUMO-like domain [Trypanosoma melophagium]